jgi:AbrB family looped-hinge helix DNA binding protein
MVLRNSYRWSTAMPTVTVSPKFQVVIPKEVREAMNITPGQKVQMMIYRGNIVLVPLRPIEELRGILKGIDTDIERDPDRL